MTIGIIQLRPNRLQPRLIQESISLQHIPDSKPRRRGQPMRHDRLHLLQRHIQPLQQGQHVNPNSGYRDCMAD
jgi:hypothetical protein